MRQQGPGFCLCLLGGLLGCQPSPATKPQEVAVTARAENETTLILEFAASIDPKRSTFQKIEIFTPFGNKDLRILDVDPDGAQLILHTDTQKGGQDYVVNLKGIVFSNIADATFPTQIHFTGYGRSQVLVRIDTRNHIVPGELRLLASIDETRGEYRDELQEHSLSDLESPGVFTATLSVMIHPNQRHALRIETKNGQAASTLWVFTVSSSASLVFDVPCTLALKPEFDVPIDSVVGDGKAPVRIILDDRGAREIRQAQLRLSIDQDGRFDLNADRLEVFRKVAGHERVYEATVEVMVDTNRRLDGTAQDSFPYVAHLVENGENFPARGTQFIMPTERPQTVIILMGNPDLRPVTFRVDAGQAWLSTDGMQRGHYPSESLFLTGEFPAAEDAFGRIAADAFSGGERATLRMWARPDFPMIFEKTIFMKPNRPYGWKVVRCPSASGCAALNRQVSSSGRAFPTVMKNLVSANIDAAGQSSVAVIDPANPGQYAQAQVSLSGQDAPGAQVLFKQEVPDLVVNVRNEAVVTPTYVIGTWRDINILNRPSEIIEQNLTIDLNPYDYDSGHIGRSPLIRNENLALDPGPRRPIPGQPEFDANDGRLDAKARQWTSPSIGQSKLPLWLAYNEQQLYVATEPAVSGRDHFVLISFSEPTSTSAMPWSKLGTMATSTATFFLAMEGDGDFQGWFARTMAVQAPDQRIEDAKTVASADAVLEGVLDLESQLGLPRTQSVWVAVFACDSPDGGALVPGSQSPTGNSDFDLQATEYFEIALSSIRSID